MNKLLLTLAGAALAFSASAATYTVNLSDPESLGVTKAAPGEATVPTAPFGTADVTITVVQGEGISQNQELRFFTNSSGVVDFRTSAKGGQKGHTFTVATTSGENMSKIEFAGTNMNFTAGAGTFDAGTKTWSGSANTVTFTTTGAVNLTAMTITTGQGGSQGGDDVHTIFTETFAASLGDFTTENVVMPEELTYVWSFASGYGAKASAYANQQAYATEAWLVSPVIDLTGCTDLTFSFDQAVNFFASIESAKTEATVWARVEGGSWTQLTPAYPETLSWAFVSSGNIDLNAYAGKKMQLGFKYTSTADKAGTWEVKNVLITGKGGSTPPEPETNEYELVSAITSGANYIFSANGKIGAAIAESATYGRLTLVDANFSGTVVKAEPVNAITITAEGNGYTLKDSYGRYLGFDGTHTTSFQLYTEVNDYTVWTIAFEGTNARITLTAEGKTGLIGVTKGTNGDWYANLAPSVDAEEVLLPTLYKEKNSSAVDFNVVDENAPVEYFNLQGIRVANPANGIFIRRQGNTITKVVVR